jgi:hypothetical protein
VDATVQIHDDYELEAKTGIIKNIETNNIKALAGWSINVNNTLKLPTSMDPTNPYKSSIYLDYIRGNANPVTNEPMALEVHSDLRMGKILPATDPLYPTGYQFRLLGDIVIPDRLDSSENHFNDIHALGGNTIDVHSNTEFHEQVQVLGHLIVDNVAGYADATPTNRNAQVSMRTLYTDRILRRGDPDEDGISVITCHGQLNFPYVSGDTMNSMASMRTIKVDRILRNGAPNEQGISIITLHGQLNLPDV